MSEATAESEVAALRAEDSGVPKHLIAFADAGLVRLVLVASDFRKASIKLILPAGFPGSGCDAQVDVSSPTLEESVTKRLASAVAAAGASAKPGTKLVAAATTGWSIIRDNLLLYAQPEVRRLRKMLKDRPGITGIKLGEAAGSVRISCKSGRYEGTLTLKVPPEYPDRPVRVSVTKPLSGTPSATTWPHLVLKPFLAQADAVARRAAAGVSAEVLSRAIGPPQAGWSADAASARADAPAAAEAAEAAAMLQGGGSGGASASASSSSSGPAASSGGGGGVRLTADAARSFKDDVRFFKEAARLRAFVSETKASNAKEKAHSGKERRRAAGYLRLMGKKEAAKEAARAEEAEAELLAEAEAAMGEAAPADAGQPCLETLWEVVGERCLLSLPGVRCPLSWKPLLPRDPAGLVALLEATSGKQAKLKPTRASCGHWFQWGAVDKALTRPPFVVPCPVCGERLMHSDWPSDTSKLERAWTAKQAKKRELDDVVDFLGEFAELRDVSKASAGDEEM